MAAIDVYVYRNSESVDTTGTQQGLEETFDSLVANSSVPDYSVTLRDTIPNIEGEGNHDLLGPFRTWLYDEYGASAAGSHLLVASGGGGIADAAGEAWNRPMAAVTSENGVVAAQEVGHNFVDGRLADVQALGHADDHEHSLGRIYEDGDVSPMAAGYIDAGHAAAGNCDSLADHSGYDQQPTECTVDAFQYSWEEHGVGNCEDAQPTSIVPYLRVGDGDTWQDWQRGTEVEIEPGQVVQFGPQPEQAYGWSWSGSGVDANSRELQVSPDESGTYTATFTNACELTSTQEFVVTVDGQSVCPDAAGGSTEVDGQAVCDLDGDGHFMDVTGDGSVDNVDVVEFFQVQHREAWKQPSLFDFSGNDSVGHGDVVALFESAANI